MSKRIALLFAGQSGLEIYQRLILDAPRALRPGGWLIMELGFGSLNGVQEKWELRVTAAAYREYQRKWGDWEPKGNVLMLGAVKKNGGWSIDLDTGALGQGEGYITGKLFNFKPMACAEMPH